MFSDPLPMPMFTICYGYLNKHDRTKKARMVCNGSVPLGTITLGHTYANSHMAASKRLFWALTAQHNLIAYGADALDDAFKDWWVNHLNWPPISPKCTVVWIKNAIQGYPESPHLWEKHIDKILHNITFQSTRHEPCLYWATINGRMVLFLRQVDDFAITARDAMTVNGIIEQINVHLRMPMKNLGIITRFNWLDVEKTRHNVKLNCSKY